MSDRPSADTQRVRIGLTGLASVFLLVLLAAVFSRASDEQPITATGIEQAATNGRMANVTQGPNEEPLAELGVAPGSPSMPANASAPTVDTVKVEDPLRPRRR